MSSTTLIGYFTDDEHALEAARELLQRGQPISEVFSPYPIHGIDQVLGRRRSRLPWVCFIGGVTGLVVAMGFQIWSSSVDWALNIGGKPFVSTPAFIPVAFELTVLFAALGTVFALLAVAGLFPGKRVRRPLTGTTDDRIAIVVTETDAAFDSTAVIALLNKHHAVDIEERLED